MPSSVRIGGASRSELRRRLGEQGVQLNPAAEALFGDGRFLTSPETRIVEIAGASVADLGFADGATYEQIVSRAHESRLMECPLELGPHLRLQFMDQSMVESGSETRGTAPSGAITITSAPLDTTDETPKGFYLRHVDGILWLRGYRSWPGHVWKPRDLLVFMRAES